MIIVNGRGKKAFVDKLVEQQINIEEKFQPKLRSLFRDMGRDLASVYISTQTIPNAENFTPQMITLLRGHYRKVIPQFGFFIRNQLGVKHHFAPEKKQIGDDFELESAVYINNHSETQSDIIIDHQQTEWHRNINKALVGLLLLMDTPASRIATTQGMDPAARTGILQNMVDANPTFNEDKKNRELRKLINREVGASSVSRAKAIALTETNNPINFAMETEAELAINDPATVAAATAAGVRLSQAQKEWVAVLDRRTRPTHVAADGQVVGLNETFNVGGFSMRFPTDGSLGAPAGEIVNCRCKSVLVI